MANSAASDLIDKTKVAASFSRCASSYDSVAQLQRDIGEQLLDSINLVKPSVLLDLGCGTGYFSQRLFECYPQSQLVNLDIAQGMLAFARQHRALESAAWLCADAEQLPLQSASIDLLFSSLVIQWCEHPAKLFTEIARTLKPNGRAYIATLGPQTLFELRDSWAEVDGYTHVNRFIDSETLIDSLPTELQLQRFEEQQRVLNYDELRQLTFELKKLGAHNMNEGQATGLTGRQRVLALKQAYEKYRDQSGKLPATYQVYYLELTRGA